MTKSFIFIFSVFLCLSVSGQKAAKIYQKIETAFDHRYYDDVLSLSDKLPKEEKTTPRYYRLLSLSFDSLHRYPDAIRYYGLYLEGTTDTVFQKRLAILKDNEDKRLAAIKAKFERIKDCPKCHGTDSVPMDISCPKCSGFKVVKMRCKRCKGTGTMICGACGGTGSLGSGKDGGPCHACAGTGGVPCSMNCDRGYLSEDCSYCSGMGYVTVQGKCDRHE